MVLTTSSIKDDLICSSSLYFGEQFYSFKWSLLSMHMVCHSLQHNIYGFSVSIILLLKQLLHNTSTTFTSDARHVWFTVLHVRTVRCFIIHFRSSTINCVTSSLWDGRMHEWTFPFFSHSNAHFQPLFIQPSSAECWFCSALPHFYAIRHVHTCESRRDFSKSPFSFV